jgi:hypothetical protein
MIKSKFGLFVYLATIGCSAFVLTINRDQLSVFSDFSKQTLERQKIRAITLADRRSVYGNRADVL